MVASYAIILRYRNFKDNEYLVVPSSPAGEAKAKPSRCAAKKTAGAKGHRPLPPHPPSQEHATG